MDSCQGFRGICWFFAGLQNDDTLNRTTNRPNCVKYALNHSPSLRVQDLRHSTERNEFVEYVFRLLHIKKVLFLIPCTLICCRSALISSLDILDWFFVNCGAFFRLRDQKMTLGPVFGM